MGRRYSAASVNGSRKRVPEFILAPCIEEELWAIGEYIARDNPDAATRVVEAAYETFKALAANPTLGRVRKSHDSRLQGVRSWLVSGFDNYVILHSRRLGIRRAVAPQCLNTKSVSNNS